MKNSLIIVKQNLVSAVFILEQEISETEPRVFALTRQGIALMSQGDSSVLVETGVQSTDFSRVSIFVKEPN